MIRCVCVCAYVHVYLYIQIYVYVWWYLSCISHIEFRRVLSVSILTVNFTSTAAEGAGKAIMNFGSPSETPMNNEITKGEREICRNGHKLTLSCIPVSANRTNWLQSIRRLLFSPHAFYATAIFLINESWQTVESTLLRKQVVMKGYCCLSVNDNAVRMSDYRMLEGMPPTCHITYDSWVCTVM